jgi:pyruvate-formate lyase
MVAWNRQEPTCEQRVEALRRTKLEHTGIKLETAGYFDVDDDGRIPWPEPIPFTPQPNHPSGGCYGAKCIGENFRRWLEGHPVYIHPMSALAGAWITYVPGVGGWRPEDRPEHLFPLHKRYNLSPGIGAANHLGPDMKIGLDSGWGGLLKKIRSCRDLNRPVDTAFYDGEEALVSGTQSWIRKHVVKAKEMAAAEENPIIRESLLTIADMNEWLIENPPRTLREACQFLAWFQCLDRMWGRGGALGQLDELLRPYYEADKEAGIITDDEEVVWYIASLFFNDTHYSKNIPRFGTACSPADRWAKRVADLYTHLVRGTPTPNGFTVIPGLFSHGDVVGIGKRLGATPNGRRAGEPISHSANPDPGFLPGGESAPTAKANAVAAVQPGWGNSAPLQLDFDKHLANECGGLEAVESLIKVHNAQGGTLININVISKEQLLEAHADPSKYPELVVRVTGYSAYFMRLSHEYRQQIVDRILAES